MAENERRGLADDPMRQRELLSSISREVLLVMVAGQLAFATLPAASKAEAPKPRTSEPAQLQHVGARSVQ